MIEAHVSYKAPVLPLVLMALLLLAVLGIGLLQYAELPFTDHARQAHAGEKWNATTIAGYFDQGGCTPTEYLCPDRDFRLDNRLSGLEDHLFYSSDLSIWFGR